MSVVSPVPLPDFSPLSLPCPPPCSPGSLGYQACAQPLDPKMEKQALERGNLTPASPRLHQEKGLQNQRPQEKMQFSTLPDDENHLVINVDFAGAFPKESNSRELGQGGSWLSQTPAVCVFRQVWEPLRAVQRGRPLLEPSGFPPRIPQATLPEWR